jgi:porin
MTVSGIEALPSTRLFNIWVEQSLGNNTSLRAGQFAASQEFLVSNNGNLFVNSTFAWPEIVSADLPSGGPNYPLATPGVRLKTSPADDITVLAAIFNGDPAGSGVGNPEQRDLFGLNFRVNDPPLFISEIEYAPKAGLGGLPTSAKLGGFVQLGRFPDARYVLQALAAGDVLNSDLPDRDGNFGLYAVLDQMLYRVRQTSDQGLNGFVRLATTPSDRNLVDFYADGGFTYKGLWPGRPDDFAGFGAAYAHISAGVNAAADVSPGPRRDEEATFELTYQMRVDEHWQLQPDLQYIVHPGGHAPNPADLTGLSAIPNALVVGMRLIGKL